MNGKWIKKKVQLNLLELKALDTIYKAMKWAEINNEPEFIC